MGNKAILMSIQPRWVAEILNGNKTIEVRKKFPKDYVGWVYIYCTKGKTLGSIIKINSEETSKLLKKPIGTICGINKGFENEKDYNLKGKVVARFWCDKVEEIEHYPYEAPEHPRGYQIAYDTQTTNWDKLCEMSCLSRDELFDYLGRNNGYAIHISKLEIFDKPREINEFGITKAPQSYMFVEDSTTI